MFYPRLPLYRKRVEIAPFIPCASLCPLCSPWLIFLTTKAQRTQSFTEKNVQFQPVSGIELPIGVPVGIADPPPGGRRLPEYGYLNLELAGGLQREQNIPFVPVDATLPFMVQCADITTLFQLQNDENKTAIPRLIVSVTLFNHALFGSGQRPAAWWSRWF